MKILLWTQYFWPEHFQINALAEMLQAQGMQVTIITGKPNYPLGKIFAGYRALGVQHETYAGMPVIRLPLWPRGDKSGLGLALNYLSFIVSGYLCAPYIVRGRAYDVVFVYGLSPILQSLPALYLARLKRAPLVLWVQDLWPESLVATGFVKNTYVLRAVDWLVRLIYRRAALLLIQGEGFRPSVARRAPPHIPIRYCPNAIADAPPDTVPSAEGVVLAAAVAQSFSVVFAGNIGTAQACETIIAAAHLLRQEPVMFYLVGEGRNAAALRQRLQAEALTNVVMPGALPALDMPALYAAASVLLLSLRDDPALAATIPSKLQGYLAAGKPIVVSSNGAAAAVVQQAVAGLAVAAEDATALAAAVRQLYALTPAARAQLGQNGRAYFKAHYHLPQRAAELIQHFAETVARHKA
jgi:glycosyltransferase involved in cell wall biosynthesis